MASVPFIALAILTPASAITAIVIIAPVP
jgi:hypothetical protein